jgi:Hint module
VATVLVQNQGAKEMTHLRIGDKVLTSKGYQPVYAFAHQDGQTQAEFLQIHTSQYPNNPLEITSQHMVFLVGKSNAVPAYTIQHGDLLQTSGFPNGAQVQKVKSIMRSGLYAPLTRDGTMVVDGILASCYVATQKNSEGYVELQGGVSTGLSHHFFSHLTMTPVRLVCIGITKDLCKLYDPDGLAYFAKILLSSAQTADNWRFFIQLVLLPVYLACMGSLYALECILGPRFSVLVLVGATLATVRWLSSIKAICDEVRKEKET